MIKRIFSDTEWQTLVFGPLWVFTGVGGADNHIDDTEIAAFAEELQELKRHKSEYIQEILKILGTHLPDHMSQFKKDTRDIFSGLREVVEILDSRCNPDEVDTILEDLFQIALRIARASSQNQYDKDNISREKQAILDLIASTLILRESEII